jgi:hypothetical protein
MPRLRQRFPPEGVEVGRFLAGGLVGFKLFQGKIKVHISSFLLTSLPVFVMMFVFTGTLTGTITDRIMITQHFIPGITTGRATRPSDRARLKTLRENPAHIKPAQK